MAKVDIEQMIRDEASKLLEKSLERLHSIGECPSANAIVTINRYLEKAILVGCVMGKTEDFDMVEPASWLSTEDK